MYLDLPTNAICVYFIQQLEQNFRASGSGEGNYGGNGPDGGEEFVDGADRWSFVEGRYPDWIYYAWERFVNEGLIDNLLQTLDASGSTASMNGTRQVSTIMFRLARAYMFLTFDLI